jgi:hypothetical protein
MIRASYLNAKIMAIITLLTLTGIGAAQEMNELGHKPGHRQYKLASLAGHYAVTGTFGPHAGGYVGVTEIDSKGVLCNGTGLVVDPSLPAPLELSITGVATINANGTGLFTEYVTVAGGPSDVPYHFNFVITDAYVQGNELIATRIVLLQQESSPLPEQPVFASFIYTRRPD